MDTTKRERMNMTKKDIKLMNATRRMAKSFENYMCESDTDEEHDYWKYMLDTTKKQCAIDLKALEDSGRDWKFRVDDSCLDRFAIVEN